MSIKKTSVREVGAWRFVAADTLLPMLTALAVLKLSGLDWFHVEVAAAAGGIDALWRLALMIPPESTVERP